MPLPHETDDDEPYDDADPDLLDMPQWLREVCSTDKSILSGRQRSMSSNSESLGQILDRLDQTLNGPSPLEKAVSELDEEVGDLQDRVELARAAGSSLAKAVDDDIQRLHQRINALAQDSTSKDYVRRQLARLWDELDRKRHEWKADEVNDAHDTDTQSLIKSVASFLPDNATRAQAERVTRWVFKSFGRRGGQALPFDRETCARLRLAKSLTSTEEANWRDYGRLPDHVDLVHPQASPTAQVTQDASLWVQQAYASLGLSPLVFPNLARR